MLPLLPLLKLMLLLSLFAASPGIPSGPPLRRFCSRNDEPGRFGTDSIAVKAGAGVLASAAAPAAEREEKEEEVPVTSAADFVFFASGVVMSAAMRTGCTRAGCAGRLHTSAEGKLFLLPADPPVELRRCSAGDRCRGCGGTDAGSEAG
jgi:hypothetical protein